MFEETSTVTRYPTHRALRSLRASCGAEHIGSYDGSGSDADSSDGDGADAGVSVLDRLDHAVARVCDREVDQRDGAIHDELARIDAATRRLMARQTNLAGTLARRAAAHAAEQHPTDAVAADRAAAEATRATRHELMDRHRWTPTRAGQTLRTAERLHEQPQPALAEAFNRGDLSPDHARVLADTLHALLGHVPDEVIAVVRDRLLEVAGRQHAVAFGRAARRLLAQASQQAASDAHTRLQQRRYGRATQDPDGLYRLSAGLVGLDAEIVATALDAYRRRDLPDERRTPEQITADALADAMRAALDRLANPGGGRSTPHVTLLLTYAELCTASGVAETTWAGPIPTSHIRELLDDAAISRVVTGPDSLPVDTGRASRTVSPGIRRGVVSRDRHCTFPGCDIPADWCQLAHIDRRWHEGAGNSIGELALVCHSHHRYLDRNNWYATIEGATTTWHPPDQRAGPPDPD